MKLAGAEGAARDAAADQLAAATEHAIQLAAAAGAQALTDGPPTVEDLSVVRDRFIAEIPALLGLLAGAWALGGAGIRLAVGAAIGTEVEAGLRALVAAGWTPPPPAADLAAAYLRAARNRLVGISDQAWADIRGELLAGMAAGEVPDQLAARVRAAAQLPLGRAQAIARTEALGAASAGEQAQVLALGVGGTKHWLSAHDARVRPTHVGADGQARPLAEPFLVGGWPMQRPHDPAGPPEETINCRCTLTYTLGPGEGEGEQEKESLAQTFIDSFSEEAANKILEVLLGGTEEGAAADAADAAAAAAQELLGSALAAEAFEAPHQARDRQGRWTDTGGGGGGAMAPITAAEARGNSRPVSAAEFQHLAAEGQERLAGFREHQSPPAGLDRNWDAIRDTAYTESQKSWGGATFDAHTGKTVQPTSGYALSIKADASSVTVPEGAKRADFDRAMNTARSRFGEELSMDKGHLGVFHDDEGHRVDIDPVLVVGSLREVETIGAATHAIGGAYGFADGNGYWPPHVAERVAAAASPPASGGHHWRGLGDWYAGVRKTQHTGQPTQASAGGPGGPQTFMAPHQARDRLGRWTGYGRPGMGDIPIDAHWTEGFKGGSAEAHLVHGADGSVSFTPERQALHDQIVGDVVAGKLAPSGQPVYHVLGGGPASGKTSLLNTERGKAMRDPNLAHVALDDIRGRLPEYQARIKAHPGESARCHEEAAYLTARATRAAMERHLGITLDTTGDSSPAILRRRLDAAHRAGYRVEGHYVTVPIPVAIGRAESRGKEIGRYVPTAGLTALHANISRTLPQSLGGFDHLELYDNSGPPGSTPTLVMHWDGKHQTVDNPGLYQGFLDKAKAEPHIMAVPEGA